MGIALALSGCGPRAGEDPGSDVSSSSTSSAPSGSSTTDPSAATTESSGSASVDTTDPIGTSSGDTSTSGGPVSSCETPPDLPQVCWDEVCDVFTCGAAPSQYDAEGCPRERCSAQDECDGDSTCVATMVTASCTFGQHGGWPCEDDDGQCICGGSLGCGPSGRAYCLDADEVDFDAVCSASDVPCQDGKLADHIGQTHFGLRQVHAELSEALHEQVRECQWIRVQRSFDECGTTACELICESLAEWWSCEPSECSAYPEAEAIEFLHAVIDHPSMVPDCTVCDELGNGLCASLFGC